LREVIEQAGKMPRRNGRHTERARKEQPLGRRSDEQRSIALRIPGAVKIRPQLEDPIRCGLEVFQACGEPSVRVEVVRGNKQRRRQPLEGRPQVSLPSAVLKESLAFGSVRCGPVVDDGREFSEELIEHR
jgi:hypothetical protein